MRRTLIAGNWKMHGSLAANASLLGSITSGIRNRDRDVVVCVPAPFFAQCKEMLADSAVAWGGQDLSEHEAGAYTGEVAASMLRDFGCTHVIVGHSERRTYHGESDDLVMRKTVRALQAELTPIVCVGETAVQRERGETESVVVRQLAAVLDGLDAAAIADIVIAYEPVWAIGTGQTPTPEMAQKVHEMLRASLAGRSPEAAVAVRILYGGSMKPENASGLLVMPDIDGGLIGGAALNARDFLAIVHAA